MSIRILKLPRYEVQSPNVEIIITARIRPELKGWVGIDPNFYNIDIVDYNGNIVYTLNPIDEKTISLRTTEIYEISLDDNDEFLSWKLNEVKSENKVG